MKLSLIGMALVLLASSAASYGDKARDPIHSPTLSLGSEFVPVLVTCGTTLNSTCPRFTDPLGQRFVVHYVTLSGRANTQCSIAAIISRQKSDGTVDTFGLTRIALWGDNQESPSRLSSDSVTLTFPEPLRGEVGDTLGVTRTPLTIGDTCGVFATFGIEYLK